MSVCVCPRCFWSLNTWTINVAAMEKEHIPLVLPARQMQLEYSTLEPFQPIAVVVDGTNPSKPQFLGFVFLVTCNGPDFFWQLSGLHLRWWEQPNPDDSQFDFYHLLLSFIVRAMLGYSNHSTAISDCPTQLSFFAALLLSCTMRLVFVFFHQGGESVYMGVFALKIANWIRSLLTSRSKKNDFGVIFRQTYLYIYLTLHLYLGWWFLVYSTVCLVAMAWRYKLELKWQRDSSDDH